MIFYIKLLILFIMILLVIYFIGMIWEGVRFILFYLVLSFWKVEKFFFYVFIIVDI